MTKRQSRMLAVGALVLGVGAAVALALTAFNQNLMYFYSPSEVLAGDAPEQARIRVGGIVEDGSFVRDSNSLRVDFRLADCDVAVAVTYTGILPDLFREGQGIIAMGNMDGDIFAADEVLAKHDENYMPPELVESLKDKQGTSCMPVAAT